MLLLPGGGSHFLTKNMKGGLGDFTFMLIGIPPAQPPSKKRMLPKSENCRFETPRFYRALFLDKSLNSMSSLLESGA